jgi:hypothetical protein
VSTEIRRPASPEFPPGETVGLDDGLYEITGADGLMRALKRVNDGLTRAYSVGQLREILARRRGPSDAVNHPPHYTSHPSGIECIVVAEHMNFCVGNAIKYLWRAGQKGDALEDLKKSKWYIEREISRLEKTRA